MTSGGWRGYVMVPVEGSRKRRVVLCGVVMANSDQ